MADRMSTEQRSRCMAAIKGKDTKPEIIVRKYLFSRGLRFRIQVRKLPGNPDIVFPKYKTIVFVDGCFWHGHENCRFSHLPKSNIDYWRTKIERNKKRDAANEAKLKELGWRVLRIWECELNPVSVRENRLTALFNEIISEPQNLTETEKWSSLLAAEPETQYGETQD